MSLIGTQQEHRHELGLRDTAKAAAEDITPNAYLKMVHKTESSKNQKQHAVGCGYDHIGVNGGHLTV